MLTMRTHILFAAHNFQSQAPVTVVCGDALKRFHGLPNKYYQWTNNMNSRDIALEDNNSIHGSKLTVALT